MRPDLAKALHQLRERAFVVEANARYIREHAPLFGDFEQAAQDLETAAREIAQLVREMDGLLG